MSAGAGAEGGGDGGDNTGGKAGLQDFRYAL